MTPEELEALYAEAMNDPEFVRDMEEFLMLAEGSLMDGLEEEPEPSPE